MGRKTGTVLSFLTIVVEIVSALFVTPLIIRIFGQAEYGVYTLALSIASYLSLLDLGVGNAVIRFMTKYKANGQLEEQRKFLGITSLYYGIVALLIITVGIGLIMTLPTVFAVGLNNAEIALAQRLLGVTMLSYAIVIGTLGFFYTAVAYENFFITKGFSLILSIIRIIVMVIALHCGMKSLGVTILHLFVTIISRGFVVIVVLVKMKLLPTLKNVKISQIKEIVTYSGFIFLQMLATQINNMADQILIGMFAASSAFVLAIYGVGSQINHYFNTFGRVINDVTMPGVVKLVENGATKDILTNEMVRIGRLNLTFTGFIWVVFLLVGKQFTTLWAGEINQYSYYVAVILMFPMVFIFSQTVGTQILCAKNMHKKQSILKLTIVLLNIILTIILIHWNPLFGATIGTFISLLLGDVIVMQWVFKKDIGIQLTEYYKGLYKGILPSLVISGIVGGIFTFIKLSGWLGLFTNILVMFLAYAICMLKFGFNQYERTLLCSINNKLWGNKNGGQ